MRLLDFEPAIQSEQLRAFLRHEPFARLQPQGHLLN
jgi:hypothetical protein